MPSSPYEPRDRHGSQEAAGHPIPWYASLVIGALAILLPASAQAVPLTVTFQINGGTFNGYYSTGPVTGGQLIVRFPDVAASVTPNYIPPSSGFISPPGRMSVLAFSLTGPDGGIQLVGNTLPLPASITFRGNPYTIGKLTYFNRTAGGDIRYLNAYATYPCWRRSGYPKQCFIRTGNPDSFGVPQNPYSLVIGFGGTIGTDGKLRIRGVATVNAQYRPPDFVHYFSGVEVKSEVPEPSAAPLLGLGLAGLVCVAARARRRGVR